ncbi:MAG TPA: UPF0182 family protein [Bryobacteraceae bacterium]|nr:UPF0182 family protein [Bryobacteraceae bacterium]
MNGSRRIGERGNPRRIVVVIAAVLLLLFFSRSICSIVIDYYWWRELGQVPTWLLMSLYRYTPGFVAWLIVFAVLWISHARGVKHAGERLRDHRFYSLITTLLFALLAIVVSLASVDGWTVARYFGGHGLAAANEWHDPAFGQPLGFYFFDLPFYSMLIDFTAAFTLGGALAYYLAARGWQIRREFPSFGTRNEIDLSDLRQLGRLESGLLKGLTAVFLVMLAANFWLGRYDLLLSDHGQLLVGLDYVEQHVGLPMQTAKAGAAVLAALLIIAGRRRLAAACAIVILIDWALPPLVSGLYVKPNELTLERPFIQRHIEATRAAYGIDRHSRQMEFAAHAEGRIDFVKNRPLLDNVRLWDWRAFQDTLGQIQPLRPYVYQDIDVDRYQIDGRLRQVLLAPRELELDQLGEARNQWINRTLTFTHGYGLALAESNRIQPDGSPILLIKDAPVEVLTPSLRVAKPQIYFGEMSHEPVFVRTGQPEFDYPSETRQVSNRYDGHGGFPMSQSGTRFLAALSESDWNILLTNQLTPESRMMIRRKIPERLSTLAEFISWDSDPYLVITETGRLVWIVDGYTTNDAHPYSRGTSIQGIGRFNYIRNAVKATVDAYDGDVDIYVFDETDPLIGAYRKLFPGLFHAAVEMPADLRAHARSPETLFRTQAEIYRTYHMREPESYYNRADMWDVATYTTGQSAEAQTVPPTYMIAKIPGETEPEFMLTMPFTPRGKRNLIGMMVARCDGPHLGELVYLDLPKQEIISGPMQVEALINQDQTISKDLTLWNQQGSQVLRNQILILPIDNTFLYVAPIFLQAQQARMPQLKKVALVVGNALVYADTYEQALAQLEAIQKGQAPIAAAPLRTSTAAPVPSTPGDPRLDEVRRHLNRYRELAAQGKWSEAGKELEAIEATVKK